MNYYELLEVNEKASYDVIKGAYKALVKQYHPDVLGDDVNANIRMTLINEAYEVLSDPKKRSEYDYAIKSHVQQKFDKSSTVNIRNFMSVEDVQTVGFHMDRSGGYNMNEVDIFLEKVESTIASYQNEIKVLKTKMKILVNEIERLRKEN